jgi:hypothetical protein
VIKSGWYTTSICIFVQLKGVVGLICSLFNDGNSENIPWNGRMIGELERV